MIWPGFTGPSYRLETPNAACDRTINWYPETIEQGPRAGQTRLRGIPGLKHFKTLEKGPVRSLWSTAGGNQLYAIGGNQLWEVFLDGRPNVLQGNVDNGTNPAIIVSNGFQLAIASAGAAFLAVGPGAVFPILDTSGAPVNAATIAFMDDYFIAAIQNSKELRISNLAPDGGTWDTGNVAFKEGYSDNIVRVFQDNEQLWLFGNETIEVWVDTGGLFPFERQSSALIQVGCDSAWSVAGVSGVRFWLWRGVVWSASGLSPVRVSDYGVEQAIKSYSYYDQTNCEAFCFINNGHIFYVLSFPESGATWVYDTSVKAWHERLFYNSPASPVGNKSGQYGRYRPRVYASAWGKDLVGDYETGEIYEMDPTVFTDAGGGTLRRQRIAPYITDEMRNVRYNRLTLDMDTGVGLSVPDGTLGFDPKVTMRFSGDRGKTWSNERQQDLGKIGENQKRVFWPALGSSRIGLTVDVVVSDPVLASINGAYLNLAGSTYPKS